MDKNGVYRHLMNVYEWKMHQSYIKNEVYETLEKYKNSQLKKMKCEHCGAPIKK